MLTRIFRSLFSISEILQQHRARIDDPGSLSDLNTPIANTSYWCTDRGSLLSVIKIEGCREYVLENVHENNISILVDSLRSQFRAGTTEYCWVHLHQDEETSNIEAIENSLRATRAVSKMQGYNNSIFHDEMVSVLKGAIQQESTLLCVWTLRNEAAFGFSKIPIMSSPGSQNTKGLIAAERLLPSHKAKMSVILDALKTTGIHARLLSNTEVSKHIAVALDPENTTFSPRLMGHIKVGNDLKGMEGSDEESRSQRFFLSQPGNIRKGIKGVDYSCIFPPKMGFQVWSHQPEYNKDYVVVGNRAFSSLMITMSPDMPVAFEVLVDSLKKQGVPFRVSMHSKSQSPGAIAAKFVLATFLKKVPGKNSLIFGSIRQMRQFIKNQNAALTLQTVITVWAPRDDLPLLRDRVQQALKAIGAWGGAQSKVMSDDSLFGLITTLAPYRSKSVAPICIGPADEVLYLAPITRPSLPWHEGGLLFRSRTGKLMPMQPLSDVLSHHVYLICGEPGYGKSLTCQMIIISIAETHDVLPYIAMTDVGKSSLGTIRYLQSILPSHRKHQVQYYELRNDKKMSINRFDTPLGVRYPLSEDLEGMRDWLLLGVSDSQTGAEEKGMDSLIAETITLAFERCSDVGPRAEPKRHEESDRDDKFWASHIQPALNRHNIKISRETLYWRLVDRLFDLGEYHAASLVQRLAVPRLDDIISACNAKEITQAYRYELSPGFTLAEYALQRLNSLKGELKVTHLPTQLDLTDVRVTSFNLESVVKQSETHSAKRSGSLYFGLTSELQVKTFFWNQERVNEIPIRYREYHQNRLREIIRTRNLYFADEQQYFTGIAVANRIPDTIATTGRKRGIGVILSTQLPRFFTDVMRELATMKIYVGFQRTSIKGVVESMNLTPNEQWILENKIRKPNREGSHMLIQVEAEDGRYSQLVNLRVGIRKLWGLSTKDQSGEVRDAITKEFGYENGLEVLSRAFPTGEVESEYERLLVQLNENSIGTSGLEGGKRANEITNIVQHIIDKTIINGKIMLGEGGKRASGQ